MSKFTNVPRPSPLPQGVGSDFLRERIEKEVPEIAIPEETPASMPPPLAYTGMSAEEDTTPQQETDYYAKERNLFSDDYLEQPSVDTYTDL